MRTVALPSQTSSYVPALTFFYESDEASDAEAVLLRADVGDRRTTSKEILLKLLCSVLPELPTGSDVLTGSTVLIKFLTFPVGSLRVILLTENILTPVIKQSKMVPFLSSGKTEVPFKGSSSVFSKSFYIHYFLLKF